MVKWFKFINHIQSECSRTFMIWFTSANMLVLYKYSNAHPNLGGKVYITFFQHILSICNFTPKDVILHIISTSISIHWTFVIEFFSRDIVNGGRGGAWDGASHPGRSRRDPDAFGPSPSHSTAASYQLTWVVAGAAPQLPQPGPIARRTVYTAAR